MGLFWEEIKQINEQDWEKKKLKGEGGRKACTD